MSIASDNQSININRHISTLTDMQDTVSFYSRKDVQEAILATATNREVAVKFGESGFGKRPDTLRYPRDVYELAKQGSTSFHISEEIWSNPRKLDTSLSKADLEKLRVGWDLVLDIDCPVLEYSIIAADVLIKALQHHGISSLSIKFSGNHGFHIGIPFSAF